MRYRSIITCLLIGVCASSNAQTPMDNYNRMRDSIMAIYNHKHDSIVDEYERFRDSCNAEYAKFLKQAWKPFKGEKGIEAPKENMRLPKEVLEQMKNTNQIVAMKTAKPEETAFNVRDAMARARNFFKSLKPAQPLVKERPSEWTRRKPEPKVKKEAEEKQTVAVQTPDVKPEIQNLIPQGKEDEKAHVDEPTVKLMSFDFYGTEMQVNIGNLHDVLKLKEATNEDVSEAWTLCSKPEYVSLIQDCLSLKREYNLGDWAYLQMIKAMADEAFGEGSDESTFLTTYIYSQSGYCVRLGRDNDRLLMLYTSHHEIYDRSIWLIDRQQFYALNASQSLSAANVCDKAFNPEEQPLSLWMNGPIKLDEKPSKERIIQSDKYPEMKMKVTVNENLIRYYNDYPNSQLGNDVLTRWAIYAETPLNEEVKQQIYPTLREELKDLPEDEQVCRLLSLIQPRDTTSGVNPWMSLVYDYDETRWGGDRVFFPEETLFYPYSDCEDHAILFSRLVRDLVGLKVLLVYYKSPPSEGNHLATAVHFTKTPTMGNGEALRYEGETYYICDPTNWIPQPGVRMDGMKNPVQVILLN